MSLNGIDPNNRQFARQFPPKAQKRSDNRKWHRREAPDD
jgi:hypothetical protein